MNIPFKPLRSPFLALCALVFLPSPGAAQSADTDAYGGSTRMKWEATGWFRLQQNNGRLWLVTPEGHPFFNLGINHLTVGWNNEQRADAELAKKLIHQFKDWVSTLRQLAATAPGKIAYVDFLLETHGGDFAKIAQTYDVKASSRAELLAAPFDAVRVDAPAVAADDAQFLRHIARTFYGVAGPAYRKNDPNHLVFGEMYLQGIHPDEVLEEAMPHIDLLLIQPTGNRDAKEPKDHFPAALFDRLHQTYRKPIIIGDHQFSFATLEFPRTMWFQYPSAAEAVAAYGAYLREATARPYIVGYNRCQVRDIVEPDGMLKQGLLQRNGEPYPDFASRIAAFNRQTLDELYNGLRP